MTELATPDDLYAYAESQGLILSEREREHIRALLVEGHGDMLPALITLDAWLDEAGL